MKLSVHFDGGSRGNPGPAAVGIVIHEVGKPEPIWEAGYFIGRTTNNAAEYTGLIRGAAKAAELGAQEVQFTSDSQLIVRQIIGEYRVKAQELKPLYEEAQMALLKLPQWQIRHVRREYNKRADELANLAMDKRQDVIVTASATADQLSPVVQAEPKPVGEGRSGAGSEAAESEASQAEAPRFEVEFMVAPGPSCPAQMRPQRIYRFGNRVPAGLCVYAAASVLTQGPLQGSYQPTKCQRCGCPIRIESAADVEA